MPFTASHVAAVLPLARTPLIPSALAIGSMVPDLPLFVSSRLVSYSTTHSFAGAATYDALLGFGVFALWHVVLAPAAVAVVPSDVRHAIARSTTLGLRQRVNTLCKCALLYLSLVTGALTHVVWDAFTHRGRWGVDAMPWLAQSHGSIAGHEFAQHASSLFGGVVVVWWCYRWLRLNGISIAALRLARGAQTACVAIAFAAAMNVLLALISGFGRRGVYRLDDAAFLVATTAIPAGALCALVLAVAWRVARLIRSMRTSLAFRDD